MKGNEGERAWLPRVRATAPNQEWAPDFASDAKASGQRLRVLSIVDGFTREYLALKVGATLPSRRVTRVLERAFAHAARL